MKLAKITSAIIALTTLALNGCASAPEPPPCNASFSTTSFSNSDYVPCNKPRSVNTRIISI